MFKRCPPGLRGERPCSSYLVAKAYFDGLEPPAWTPRFQPTATSALNHSVCEAIYGEEIEVKHHRPKTANGEQGVMGSVQELSNLIRR